MGKRMAAMLVGAWIMVAGMGAGAAPKWVVEPYQPEPDLPPAGRSLFDHLIGTGPVPFPFETLLETIGTRMRPGDGLERPVKRVLIPLGRSLQREAGAPAFFRFPRAVAAVDGEPNPAEGESGILLRNRLYLGYLEKADVLEVISYNEAAARFEFQVVRDYRADGARRILYAPRALCRACHQNAAPLFARPLWDETNAAEAVAKGLGAEQRDFYGFPLKQGVDMAYAIDNATDRANGYSLGQRLWNQGCGAGETARNCRAQILKRALQLLLSGNRGFDAQSPGHRQLVDHMGRIRNRHWPDGLWLPNPDIPNRKPLERVAVLQPTDSDAEIGNRAAALFGESSIPAHFEPLAQRSPLETWNPTSEHWTARAVQGLTDFLARVDGERLDAALAERTAQTRSLSAPCTLSSADLDDGRSRYKLNCKADGLVLRGRIYRSADGRLRGHLSRIRVQNMDLGRLELDGHTDRDGIRLSPRRGTRPGSVRLADGNALASLHLSPAETPSGNGRITLYIRLDFDPVTTALQTLVEKKHASLGAAPFRRGTALDALFSELGMGTLDWCCLADEHLPPAVTEHLPDGRQAPELAPFYQVCARCHRGGSPFPPNFLAGDAEQVKARVGHCSERIAFRLGMWGLAAEHRPKTPMPPQFILPALGSDEKRWPQGPELKALRTALKQFAPASPDLLEREYTSLRPCLSAAETQGSRP